MMDSSQTVQAESALEVREGKEALRLREEEGKHPVQEVLEELMTSSQEMSGRWGSSTSWLPVQDADDSEKRSVNLTRSGQFSTRTESGWWAHKGKDQRREEVWDVDALSDSEVMAYVGHLMDADEEEWGHLDFVEGDAAMTLPGFSMEPERVLWGEMERVVLGVKGAAYVEVEDVQGDVYAGFIAVDGHVGCGVFLEGSLVWERVEGMGEELCARLRGMASLGLDVRLWSEGSAWDWSGVELGLMERYALSVSTGRALRHILQSPKADGASVVVRALEGFVPRLSVFHPLALAAESLGSGDGLESGVMREDPAVCLYEIHRDKAEFGGLFRWLEEGEVLHPVDMVGVDLEGLQRDDTAVFQDSAMAWLSAQEKGGMLGESSEVFQIRVGLDGFWAMLSTASWVVLVRLPLELMGQVYSHATRFLEET